MLIDFFFWGGGGTITRGLQGVIVSPSKILNYIAHLYFKIFGTFLSHQELRMIIDWSILCN